MNGIDMTRRRGGVLGMVCLAGGLGCSLTLGLDDARPCASDADCVYSSGQGTCVDQVCRPPGDDEGTTGDSGPTSSGIEPTTATATAPSTTDDPTLESSGQASDGETGSTSATAGCSRNGECALDQRCGGDGTCIDLLSPECPTLQWPDDHDRDDVVFLGTIFPTGGAFANLVQPLENAAQLGIEDFNEETTLQGDRRVAWVGCDDTTGADTAVAAATHLVQNVGVPAIVGPVFSESVIAVAEDVSIDAGVFLVTPTASAVSISSLPDDDLVWRTIAPDTYQANAIVDRMHDLTTEAFPLQRLLVLAKGDAYGNGLLTAVQPELEAVLPGSVEIHFASYENPAGFASQEEMLASYGAVIASAFGTLPGTYADPDDHFTDVLVIGTSEAQALLYAYISAWSLTLGPPTPDPPLPRFTFSHGAVPDMARYVSEIGVVPGTEPLEPLAPLIRSQLEGITPVVFDPENFAAFNIRYRIRFNDQVPLTASSLSYDATLATLFAMCTVGDDDPVTGAAIASAMPRLMDPQGTFVSFSGATLAFISQARNRLVVADGAVDLRGVSGELLWDAEGDIRSDLLGWDLLDNGGAPLLAATRTYLLGPAPAEDGAWSDL
jgi:branched-chain amino acid transport system substrate-binding protein